MARRNDNLDDRSQQAGAKDRAADSVLAAQGFDSQLQWASINEAGPVRFDLRLLSELKKRLAVAECVQWDSRKGGVMQPAQNARLRLLGVADWRLLAREDTGSMFEICACLGSRTQRFRRLGRLLGMLYHGCDDVADVFDLKGLGGGGAEDLQEGILTLPAALAIEQSAEIRRLFTQRESSAADLDTLRKAFVAQLPRAASELDEIRRQLELELTQVGVKNMAQFHRLIEHVRQLAPPADAEFTA